MTTTYQKPNTTAPITLSTVKTKTVFKEKVNPATTLKYKPTIVPKVYISEEALRKMRIYVEEMADEIGWLGTTEREGTDIFVKDVFLLRQEVHGTTTEITPEGLEEFATSLLQEPDGIDTWNSMKLWGHSHVNMGVTPSAQDNTQMNVFESTGHDYFLRLIANKKGEVRIDVYEYDKGLEFHDVPWFRGGDDAEQHSLRDEIARLRAEIEQVEKQLVEYDETKADEVRADIQEEIKEKVSKIVFNQYGTGAYGGVKPYTPTTSHKGGSAQFPYPRGRVQKILTQSDIYKFFTDQELKELALDCNSYSDLMNELQILGLLDQLTALDCSKLWTAVMDVQDEIFQYAKQ